MAGRMIFGQSKTKTIAGREHDQPLNLQPDQVTELIFMGARVDPPESGFAAISPPGMAPRCIQDSTIDHDYSWLKMPDTDVTADRHSQQAITRIAP